VFHRFSGGDGTYPTASLIQNQSGNFYGTTWAGGRFDYGTVFKLEPSGKETVLHSFDGADGMNPMGGVVLDASGNLYGTTTNGGTREGGGCTHGCGTVFRIDRAEKYTVMHAFTGKADGGTPSTNLILDNVGNLYGTASSGGHFDGECFLSGSCGLVFKLDAHGNATVLYSFTGSRRTEHNRVADWSRMMLETSMEPLISVERPAYMAPYSSWIQPGWKQSFTTSQTEQMARDRRGPWCGIRWGIFTE
jgi:uncharacterized repeat protein (TIGR03803 family)